MPEEREQDDDRQRHAKQQQQYSTSHDFLPRVLIIVELRFRRECSEILNAIAVLSFLLFGLPPIRDRQVFIVNY
jgi:hypothetical protein